LGGFIKKFWVSLDLESIGSIWKILFKYLVELVVERIPGRFGEFWIISIL